MAASCLFCQRSCADAPNYHVSPVPKRPNGEVNKFRVLTPRVRCVRGSENTSLFPNALNEMRDFMARFSIMVGLIVFACWPAPALACKYSVRDVGFVETEARP